MAKTVTNAFSLFSSNLEITGLQRSTVSTRQQTIRETLENEMSVLDSFLTGSYCRHTMIAPLAKADIDILVVLSASHYSASGQKSLLQEVKRVLRSRYPKTPDISPNGQAVTIQFADFLVDVVPGFNRQGDGYIIPDANAGVWISTNPKFHVEYKTAHNDNHNGDLVPIIKMIKAWNRHNNNAFVSFYLELIAIEIFDGIKISCFPSGIRYFFDKAREKTKYATRDPVSIGGWVQGLRNVKTVADAVALFERNYRMALRAEGFNASDDNRSAIAEWQKIFGNQFPAYS